MNKTVLDNDPKEMSTLVLVPKGSDATDLLTCLIYRETRCNLFIHTRSKDTTLQIPVRHMSMWYNETIDLINRLDPWNGGGLTKVLGQKISIIDGCDQEFFDHPGFWSFHLYSKEFSHKLYYVTYIDTNQILQLKSRTYNNVVITKDLVDSMESHQLESVGFCGDAILLMKQWPKKSKNWFFSVKFDKNHQTILALDEKTGIFIKHTDRLVDVDFIFQ
jgi:hypothetical protein